MTFAFYLGRYTYYTREEDGYYFIQSANSADRSRVDDRIKYYDYMLHQSLDNIFRDTGRVKEFLCGPQNNTDYNSIISPILKQEPILSKYFSKEELGKLSLLWIAVLGCYEKSAELLVRSGADVNELFGRHNPQVIEQSWTILYLLLKMGPSPENERLIRLVTDYGANLQARDYKGRTVLHYAIEQDHIQMTEMLLEKGADVNAADNDGMTPLLIAASYSYKADELLPFLIKHGADIFAKNSRGENALHRLASAPRQYVDLARILCEKGVSLDDRDLDLNQPIHLAAKFPYTDLVKLYLDYGANVNALGNWGESPLHKAAQFGSNTIVETLLKRGANIGLRTFNGHTALHYACLHAAIAVSLEHLRRRFPTYTDDKPKIILQLLLSAGANVLAEDTVGRTPFALFSYRRDGRPPGEESWPIIEALALKKALQPSIELKDERIIERYPKLLDHYRKCIEEIDKMKITSFIETCNFFELLEKSQCQTAGLMQNPEFETKFRLYDLNNGLSIYAENIVRAFDRAQDLYHSLLEQMDVINEAVYNILPYVVVNKVVHYIFNCCNNVK